MNTLITAVMIGVLTGGCACAPLQGTVSLSTREDKVHTKRSETATLNSHTAHTQEAWSLQGYTGPTAVPVLLGEGTIAETPEVAAARAAHLAALEISRGTNPDMDDGYYDPHKYGDHLYGISLHSGEVSKSIEAHSTLPQSSSRRSDLAGTDDQHATGIVHEAAHSQAKASAEAALALWKTKIFSAGEHTHGASFWQNKPYTGPLAMLELLPTGYLADTLEVTAAKKTHLSALAEAHAAEALWRAQLKNQHHSWN